MRMLTILAPAFAIFVTCAAAQESPAAGRWLLRPSFGFTLDPDSFLLGVEVDGALTDDLYVGPLVQFVIADRHTMVAPTINLRYEFDLADFGVREQSRELARLRPFLEAAFGVVFAHRDREGGEDDNDVGFIVGPGLGVDYCLTDHFSLGTSMRFNVIPGGVDDEHFFFAWQVVTATFRF